MKIILDLDKSINNYDYDEKEIKMVIESSLNTLWNKYDYECESFEEDEEHFALYNILDMFRSFEIKENGDKNE